VLQDLRCVGVFLRGHVPGLLEQREVDIGLDVALGARIAVPVPGPAEAATLLDDEKVVDTGLSQPGPGDEPGETASDHDHGHGVAPGRPFHPADVRIVEVMGIWAGDLDVLVVGIRPEPLVALAPVAVAEGVRVESLVWRGARCGRHDLVPLCRRLGGTIPDEAPAG
jgi:hypothetical protein